MHQFEQEYIYGVSVSSCIYREQILKGFVKLEIPNERPGVGTGDYLGDEFASEICLSYTYLCSMSIKTG